MRAHLPRNAIFFHVEKGGTNMTHMEKNHTVSFFVVIINPF